MNPQQFVLWLSGVADAIGDAPPSPQQWEVVRTRMSEVIGALVADRLRGVKQYRFEDYGF